VEIATNILIYMNTTSPKNSKTETRQQSTDNVSKESKNTPEDNKYAVDPNEWTLSPLVEEARQKFAGEEGRRNFVETKLSFVVGINALIVSILGSSFLPNIDARLIGIILVPAIISVIIGLFQMRVRIYSVPFADFENYYLTYAKESEKEIQDRILMSYIDAIKHNANLNTSKFKWLNVSLVLTGVSILFVTLHVIFGSLQLMGSVLAISQQYFSLIAIIYIMLIIGLGAWAYSRDVKSIDDLDSLPQETV
jgi:hypothetical protein